MNVMHVSFPLLSLFDPPPACMHADQEETPLSVDDIKRTAIDSRERNKLLACLLPSFLPS
jgi:hypothetical protein